MSNFFDSFKSFILDYPFMAFLIFPFFVELYFLMSYSFYYIHKKLFRKLKRYFYSIFDKDDIPYFILCLFWIVTVPIIFLLFIIF